MGLVSQGEICVVRQLLRVLCALSLMSILAGEAMASEADAWAALAKGGMVIIMRHADAPGPQQGREGDPPGFRLDDCTTQRNLSPTGRRQSAEIGNMFRAHQVTISEIMTSPWCRAKDTAQLMNLGAPMNTTPLLRNLGEHIAGAGVANEHMPGVKIIIGRVHGIIQNWRGPGNLLMVSHGRTVTAVLYGDGRPSPEQAALYVLQPTPGASMPFREVGSISPPE
jgi:phosphohistidine phosphatase SixA